MNLTITDDLKPTYDPQSARVRLAGGSPPWPLVAFVSTLKASVLSRAIAGVLERSEFPIDEGGFRYPNEHLLDIGEELWHGVEIDVMQQCVVIPEPDFARLMLRVAQTFISGATDCDHAMLREPWWPELLDATARLEAMVAALPPDESAA